MTQTTINPEVVEPLKLEDIYDVFNHLDDKKIKIIDTIALSKKYYDALLKDVKEEENKSLLVGFGMKVLYSETMPEDLAMLKYQNGDQQIVNFKTGKMSEIIKSIKYDFQTI